MMEEDGGTEMKVFTRAGGAGGHHHSRSGSGGGSSSSGSRRGYGGGGRRSRRGRRNKRKKLTEEEAIFSEEPSSSSASDEEEEQEKDSFDEVASEHENGVPMALPPGGRLGKWKLVLAGFALVIGFALMSVSILLYLDSQKPHDTEDAEKVFMESISTDSIRSHLRNISATVSLPGFASSKEGAEAMKAKLEEFGLENVYMETVPVLISQPIHRLVQILPSATSSSPIYTATLSEEPLSSQNKSQQFGDPNAVPPFSAYSASGNATAPLLYVNFGREEDFDALEQLFLSNNINHVVNGSIVIARYNDQMFRGNVVRLAQERGAAGCLLYPDPLFSSQPAGGAKQNEAYYPEGSRVPPSANPRGSVWLGAGDPSTPGWPSTLSGPRMTTAQTLNDWHEDLDQGMEARRKGYEPLPTIPVQPISWKDAEVLLRRLKGAEAPKEWQGGGNFTYRVGVGEEAVEDEQVIVHLEVELGSLVVNAWNVLARINGISEPDRMIILGNHRDAWVYGGGDPHSGTAAFLEVCKGVAKAVKSGWKPGRSILLASWDAGEYNAAGSIEFVERHRRMLQIQNVLYINVDHGVEGTDLLLGRGTPTLQPFFDSVLRTLSSPSSSFNPVSPSSSSATLYNIWKDKKLKPVGLDDTLGFVQLVGVPSLDVRFVSSSPKHSAIKNTGYDTADFVERFVDPGLVYHATLVRTLGALLFRFVDQKILPLEYNNYCVLLRQSHQDITNNALNRELYDELEQELQQLEQKVGQFCEGATNLTARVDEIKSRTTIHPDLQRRVNNRLMWAERAFLDESGTIGRKMLRHILFAPSHNNWYAETLLPSIYAALNQESVPEASFQILRTTQTLDQVLEVLLGTTMEVFAGSSAEEEEEEERRGLRRGQRRSRSTISSFFW
ncbi:Glutamate carboxypeptidase 2 [Balamuthia mandrillaris]